MKKMFNKGFSVIEIIIAIGIGFIFLIGVIQSLQFAKALVERNENHLQAIHFVGEELELVRALRNEDGWSAFSEVVAGSLYHVAEEGGLSLDPSCTENGIYSLCIIPGMVYRDDETGHPYMSDDVSRTLDPDTFQFTAEVTWMNSKRQEKASQSILLTNWNNEL